MKTYQIRRTSNGTQVQVTEPHNELEPIEIETPSATVLYTEYPLVDVKGGGFEYGYMGSGPANLALAILCNYLGEANLTREELNNHPFLAWKLRHYFKEDMIATLNQEKDYHEITESAIRGWLKMRYPEIDVETYKERRESYRRDLRLYDGMETLLESTTLSGEDFIHTHDEWHRAFERILAFEKWLLDLVQNATTES